MSIKSGAAWAQTICLLGIYSIRPENRRGRRRGSSFAMEPGHDVHHSGSVSVRLIELPSATTAIIAWSDPTSCCYGAQVWRQGVAPRTGVCAATGRPIFRGDVVYRPRAGQPAPANSKAMILSTVLYGIAIAEGLLPPKPSL
ncbi:DUF3331 domain-containing protein [Caballeronia sp. M23-90]